MLIKFKEQEMNLHFKIRKYLRSIIIFQLCLFLIPIILNSQNYEDKNSTSFNTQDLSGERIFFTKHKVEQGIVLGDIYSMDPYGGSVQQLTNFSKDFYITERPALSADGTKLGFISNFEEWKSSNYADAFVIDFITNKIDRVTGFEKIEQTAETGTVSVTVNDPKGYAISPSAIRISFRGCTNFVTGNSATLTIPANEEIWVKAEVARGKGDIKLVNVPTGGSSSLELDLMNGTITSVACSPSPNGSLMAVTRNSETFSDSGEAIGSLKNYIWDTNKKEIIAEAGGWGLGGDKDPAYSPDGSMLAVCTGELLSNSLGVLFTSNISANPKILVEGKRFFNQEFCSDPTWSPDSKNIVFVYTVMNTSGNLEANLFKISASGGTTVQLTFYSGNQIVSRPSYSPDGSKIAFNLLTANNTTFSLFDWTFLNFTSDINIIPSNGGSATAITNDGNALDPSWGFVNTSVDVRNQKEVPNTIKLYQNYPNPFNPSTNIQFTIPNSSSTFSPSKIILKVYNILGEEVAELINNNLIAGEYNVTFNGRNLNSGVYFYELRMNGYKLVKKMLLIK